MDTISYLQYLLFIGSALFAGFLIGLYIILHNLSTPLPKIIVHNAEKVYRDPQSGKEMNFADLDDVPVLRYSIIVPAYNEEERICKMLDECIAFMESELKADAVNTYEIIVVNDGSKDTTVDVVMKYCRQWTTEKVRLLDLVHNRGKGGAVRLGMMSARGEYLLFADADGATRFSEFAKISTEMHKISPKWTDNGIVIGSRAHLQDDAVAERTFFRTVLMYGFHFLVYLLAVRKVRDTQCGFKMLSRTSARTLFRLMHVERWAFDVELLYLAERLNIPVVEIAVHWTEIEGSKIVPFWSWLQMGRDLLLIWYHYTTRIWRVDLSKDD